MKTNRKLLSSVFLVAGLLLSPLLQNSAYAEPPVESSATAPDSSAATRWSKLSESEKEQVRENYRKWKSLSTEEQTDYRERFQRFRSLPESERKIVVDRYRKFKTLPIERQNKIRERFREFRKLPKAEREVRLQRLRERRQTRTERTGQNSAPGTHPLRNRLKRNQ